MTGATRMGATGMGAPETVTLPNRRLAVTQTLDWAGHTFLMGVGFALDGTVREVFLQGMKTGSDLECLLDDACILASKLMQAQGGAYRAADLADALRGPDSLLSLALSKAAQVEADSADIVREVYHHAGG